MSKPQINGKRRWLNRAGFDLIGSISQLRRRIKKLEIDQRVYTVKLRGLQKQEQVFSTKMKILLAKKKSLQFSVGRRVAKRCPCFKDQVIEHKPYYSGKSWFTHRLICLARKNTWTYDLIERDFLRTYCGQCTMSAEYRLKKALIRQVEGDWRKTNESA